jgi:hypothetical protein
MFREIKTYKNVPICIDFDGTIVEHDYPRIGKPVPLAIETMKGLQEQGALLILFTMRSGKYLQEAVDYLKDNGIELYGVNTNPSQSTWTQSPKAYGQIYIDDAALGCPTLVVDGGRPMVDWIMVRQYLGLLIK